MKLITVVLHSVAALLIALGGTTDAAKMINEVDFLPYYPFFPYGKNFDYVLTDPPNYVFAEGDEDYGVFDHYLQKDLPMFHNPHTRWLFMGVNGYISFEQPLLSNKAEKYPLPGPALNAFHTDFIFTNAADSHMSFQEYTEDEPAMMGLAQFELELFGRQTNFQPNHVIVVTWKNAQKKGSTGKVTFQVVIVSDGFNTFAILNYEDLNLSGWGNKFCPVTIGWQENKKHYIPHKNMQLKRGYPYRPSYMSRQSNVGFPGKWIYHLFQSKISDGNMPPPPPPGPSRPLPARCPGRYFCRKRHQTLNAWYGYPGFYVVCPPSGTPTCMACPADTVFDEHCQTCIHHYQKPGTCPTPPDRIPDRVKQTPICNHADAKQYCALKKIQLHKKKSSLFQGRFRNHNDITGRSFYLCVDIYGSFCMPCAPGTVFRQSKHNKNNGGCVHAYSAQFIKW